MRRAGILAGTLTLSAGAVLSKLTATGLGLSSSVKCVQGKRNMILLPREPSVMLEPTKLRARFQRPLSSAGESEPWKRRIVSSSH